MTRPSISSETRERRKEARGELARGIDEALCIFVETLNDLARKYERSEKYVHALAGIGNVKRLKKGPTTMYGAFLSKKLAEENEGKAEGSKTTLAEFLPKNKLKLQAEYKTLKEKEKEAILFDFCKAKEEKSNTPKNLSNKSISKIVDFRVQCVTSICQELNDDYGTECLVIFSRGNIAHTYSAASYASPGAENWLASADIGRNKPHLVAMQLEGFAISGCTKPIEEALDAPESAKRRYHIIRQACRNLIQEGLENILKLKKHPNPTVKMNYENYERQIVERLGVELVGWPLHGTICQPGKLPIDDAAVLRNALKCGDCKWVKLNHDQVETRKDNNQKRHADGEAIYGPPRKQRKRNKAPTNRKDGSSTDNGQIDEEMDEL